MKNNSVRNDSAWSISATDIQDYMHKMNQNRSQTFAWEGFTTQLHHGVKKNL